MHLRELEVNFPHRACTLEIPNGPKTKKREESHEPI